MSKDKELLELAAKAAGYPEEWKGEIKVMEDAPVYERYWNPLTDDGDALRLVVKLCINLEDAIYDHLERNIGSYDDQYAATRLAIVRAAAEIGQRMP